MRGVVALDLRRCDQDEETVGRGLRQRFLDVGARE